VTALVWLNGRVDRLVGRRALVTGGNSGIGAAIVHRLVGEGARVVFTGRDEQRGEQVARSTGAAFVAADVRDRAAITRSVDAAVDVLGGLDIAVLNAGVIEQAMLSETTDEAWDATIDTNLVAPYRYACCVMPLLAAAGGGAIVITASIAGVWCEREIGAYSVSKRAVIMLTRMLAAEGGPQGVRVNCVCPGDTEPGMVTGVHGRDALPDPNDFTKPPLGTNVHADDVAAATAHLVSDDARTVSGADLLIDGAMRSARQANTIWAGLQR
jgi:NAD(P)-dependent dehydrogenase (short-subunit alcohol dehydrogenase family)